MMSSVQQISGPKVSTVGEILVEIMSLDTGISFRECQNLRGPYPSGAPAIFIDQIAKLGLPASIVGAVGEDDFGQLNIERLQRDGVDINAIQVCADKPTGIAFVRYQPDGHRDFLFTLGTSAATQINIDRLHEQLANTTHLHVVGSSMSVASISDYVIKAVDYVKREGGTISFDPNVRPEIMQQDTMQGRLTHVLHSCDIFLPSEGEISIFCGIANEQEAVAALLEIGVTEIVIKKGKSGAAHYTKGSHQFYKAYAVDEIDPTGAGDCFGATYVASRLLGRGFDDAMSLACAAGALAVTQQGPMEGNSSLAELEAFILHQVKAGAS